MGLVGGPDDLYVVHFRVAYCSNCHYYKHSLVEPTAREKTEALFKHYKATEVKLAHLLYCMRLDSNSFFYNFPIAIIDQMMLHLPLQCWEVARPRQTGKCTLL